MINDSKIVASYPGIPTSSPVVATVNLENTPIAIAYDPLKGEVFVGNAIVSDNNNSVVATISFPEGEGGPYSICYDSGKEVIFYGGSLGLNVTVLAMDDNSNVFVAALTLPRGTPSGIAFIRRTANFT